ncbi:MAG: ATP-binding protein [Treponemataceae bacterium]
MSNLETKSLSDTVITTVKPAAKEGKKIRWNILQAIFSIKEAMPKSKLKPRLSKKTEKMLERLNNYLNTETIETFLFCCIFSAGIDDAIDANFVQLKEYLDMTSSQFVSHKKHLESLQRKGLTIQNDNPFSPSCDNYFTKNYRIPESISQSIIENKSLVIIRDNKKEKDSTSFLLMVIDLLDKASEFYSPTLLFADVKKIERAYRHLPMIRTMEKNIPSIDDRLFFYLVCELMHQNEHKENTLNNILIHIYSQPSQYYQKAQTFINKTHTLLQQDLIQFEKKGSVQNTTFTLTDKGWDVFLGEHANLFKKKFDDSKLLKPDDIKEKSLFYSKKNEKEINHLQAVFEEKQFSLLQKRLAKESLPSGVAVLFYGSPGTGKTESVYQIAKKTGRAIFHVDISKTKTCWYGESEKLIKNIFSSYKTMCKIASQSTIEKMPILLFNEADAIFSKRSENPSRSTDKTDNAIQNIILEEMENLQGILIATTNLATNFDAAFERRFLFKIKFESPSTEAKKLIWKNKIQWISEDLSHKLASEYLFSGGEIDNIARKISLHHIVTGKKPCKDEIIEFCQSEKILAANSESKTVGF